MQQSSIQPAEGKNNLSVLLRTWIEADATNDPEELERRDADRQEFEANINANHSSYRKIYP